MKILVLFTCLLAVCQAISYFDLVQEEWTLFKLHHKKEYKNDMEEKFRLKIFMENKKKVLRHNKHYEQGVVSFKLKLNHFADLLPHEFVNSMNGFNRSLIQTNRRKSIGSTYIHPENVELPQSIDWRTKGAVTPVKDQGHCGSCWAFSTTGSLEGQHFRKTGKLVSLSEQNLIDCSADYGNNGCNGGLMDNAFQYVKENGGIDTEKFYPYEGREDECRYNKDGKGAIDTGFVDIPEGNEHKLMAAVATVGPVSVAIDASHESFQFYSEGVYHEPECSSENLDHGVLVVGYGETDNGKEYWIVKNSWGTSWGDQGYIRMTRNKHNNCGIATSASYPLV
uniref:Venom C1A protease 2 n=1 Tax=Lethocerus distinctifemur TaxID=280095 RepID=A0A2K8JRS2_9HEMI|nr:venom C1A protease 2 [Lethocerus distinctifemur]